MTGESSTFTTTQETKDYYRTKYGEEPPDLHAGDIVRVGQYPRDRFVVVGVRANGMLVETVRDGDGQEFCMPRYQYDEGWVRPLG